MRNCAVIGCMNKKPTKDISFFGFPKDKNMTKMWLIKLRRKDYKPNSYSTICSTHFEESCFAFQNFTNRRFLKPGSVPTLFPWTKEIKPRRDIVKHPLPEKIKPIKQEVGHIILKTIVPPSRANASTQTDASFVSIMDELVHLGRQVDHLKEEVEKHKFQPSSVSTDSQMRALTGFNKHEFEPFFKRLNIEHIINTKSCKLEALDQFFMFMVKLRTGISHEFLGTLFHLSESSVSRVVSFFHDLLFSSNALSEVHRNLLLSIKDRGYF